MAYYRRKPLEVEAVAWLGRPELIPRTAWLMEAKRRGAVTVEAQPHGGDFLRIRPNVLLRDGAAARPGDVILRHADGTLEALSAEAFRQGYESIDPPAAAKAHGTAGSAQRGISDPWAGRPATGAPATCKADRDGECSHPGCPQLRDGEPRASGRSCPLPDLGDGDDAAPLQPEHRQRVRGRVRARREGALAPASEVVCDDCDSAGRCTYLCEDATRQR